MIERESQWIEELLKPIMNGKIIGLVVDDQSYGEPCYGLVVIKHDKRFIVWVLCDPEGNGPGHLDIVEHPDQHSPLD